MKVLVTGTRSGLGRHVHVEFGGVSLTRASFPEEWEKIKEDSFDVIIHCAFNSRSDVNTETLYGYMSDNVLLTEELVSISHKKFIFLSTVDVYPETGEPHLEDQVIELGSVKGIYGITKLMSESIVRERSGNYLILRASALLGKYSRKSSLIKILEDEESKLSLSGESSFNYVLHSDLSDFMKFAIERDLTGIYNVVSSDSVRLLEVRDMTENKVEFGSYVYGTQEIDNTKASLVFEPFKKTSKEVITQFMKERNV